MIKETILGVDVLVSSYENLLDDIEDDIRQGKQAEVISINPEKIISARNSVSLKQFLNDATYTIPDGIGIVLASKIKKGAISSRMTGIETMDKLCSLSNNKGYKIFLYGSGKEVLSKARRTLETRYEQINIVGCQDGYEKDSQKVIDKINASKAQILFLALGSPKQEEFIMAHRQELCITIFQGVGGSFDILSGKVQRAPLWMQKVGLEWLYRLAREPKRIFRQINLVKFLALVFFEKQKQ